MVLQDDQLILVKPNLMIEYNNYEYTVEQTRKICFQKNSFDVDRLGNGVSIKSRKYNYTILYSTNGDIKIGVNLKISTLFEYPSKFSINLSNIDYVTCV